MIIPALFLASLAWLNKPRAGQSVKIRSDGTAPAEAAARLARAAAPALKTSQVPLSVAVAIGMAETLYGKALPGKNWYGIKGIGPAGSVTVPTKEEFQPGKVTKQKSAFRAYATDGDAVKDFAGFVSTDRYRPAWKMSRGGAVMWLWAMGYSTASRWPQFVAAVSRGVAKRLAAPALAFSLSPQQLALVKKLATIPAGAKRRTAAKLVYEAGKWPT